MILQPHCPEGVNIYHKTKRGYPQSWHKVETLFCLYNDDSVKKKLTVMNKFECAMNDERNFGTEFADIVESFLQLGGKYRMTIERIG